MMSLEASLTWSMKLLYDEPGVFPDLEYEAMMSLEASLTWSMKL